MKFEPTLEKSIVLDTIKESSVSNISNLCYSFIFILKPAKILNSNFPFEKLRSKIFNLSNPAVIF